MDGLQGASCCSQIPPSALRPSDSTMTKPYVLCNLPAMPHSNPVLSAFALRVPAGSRPESACMLASPAPRAGSERSRLLARAAGAEMARLVLPEVQHDSVEFTHDQWTGFHEVLCYDDLCGSPFNHFLETRTLQGENIRVYSCDGLLPVNA